MSMHRHRRKRAMPDEDFSPQDGNGLEVPARFSRREFMSHFGTTNLIAGSMALSTPLLKAADESLPAGGPSQDTVPVSLNVNGTMRKAQIDPRSTLLDTLRETLHLTGTKKG